MVDLDKYLKMLESPEADERYDACEELRVAPAITAEATLALQKALNDPDPDVAEVAQKALDVHRSVLQADPGIDAGAFAAPLAGRPPQYSYPDLLKQLHSWGIWMLIFGVIQFFLAKSLFSPWGFLMVLVGLASFYFKTSAMYILYAITLLWAAISNAISGQAGWMILGVVQVVWCYQNFRNFFRYRNVEAEYLAQPDTAPAQQATHKKADSLFPITGCLVGALSIMAVLTFIIIVFWEVGANPNGEASEGIMTILDAIFGIVDALAILGFGVSLAALLARYRRKTLAILGLVASGSVIVLYVALVLWSRFG